MISGKPHALVDFGVFGLGMGPSVTSTRKSMHLDHCDRLVASI